MSKEVDNKSDVVLHLNEFTKSRQMLAFMFYLEKYSTAFTVCIAAGLGEKSRNWII
jgi:hypothetical protein